MIDSIDHISGSKRIIYVRLFTSALVLLFREIISVLAEAEFGWMICDALAAHGTSRTAPTVAGCRMTAIITKTLGLFVRTQNKLTNLN